jgi:hypothetical protein
MAILNFLLNAIGNTGNVPRFVFLNTNDTVATVSTAGYLNHFVSQGNQLFETDMAVVVTRTTPNAFTATVDLFNVTFSGGNWSLTTNSTPLALANGQIFVGNAGGVATGVTMSGDATVSNTGVLTIAANAITTAKITDANVTTAKIADANVTTAKILDANVTLAKLDAGITPSHIIKFAGKQANGGGSATIAITVTGTLVTDVVFAQIQESTNAVTVQKVTPTSDTVTVLLSGDPGAATTISYQVLRAAS